jgi:hypothetical protein
VGVEPAARSSRGIFLPATASAASPWRFGLFAVWAIPIFARGLCNQHPSGEMSPGQRKILYRIRIAKRGSLLFSGDIRGRRIDEGRFARLCPVAGFAGDAPRLGSGAQSYFAGGLDDQITILAGLLAESGSPAMIGERKTLRERAISLHCQMVGALVLSRSVAQVAPAHSNEILENVQQDILASIDGALRQSTDVEASRSQLQAATST